MSETTISFYCPCGAKLKASASKSGQTFNCPSCKTPVVVPGELQSQQAEEPLPLPANLTIDLGSVNGDTGTITFKLVVESSGNGHIQIYAYDPRNLRKSGVFLQLGQAEYKELQTVLANAESTISRFVASKQMKQRLEFRWK